MSQEINQSQSFSTEIKEDNFDTTGLILDYLKNWKWFLLCVIITTGIAYYYSATIIPTYQVNATVYLDDDQSTKTNAVTISKDDPMVDMKTYIDETEIEILKSRNNLLKIVDSLKMSYAYYYVGTLRDIPAYHSSAIIVSMDSTSLYHLGSPITLTVDKNDNGYNINCQTKISGNLYEVEKTYKKLPAKIELPCGVVNVAPSQLSSKMHGTEKIVITNPNSVAARLAGQLSIEFAEKSNTVLRVQLNTMLIDQGQDVINTLIDFYNKQIIEDKNRSAIQTEAFIIDRLVMIHDELKDVENRLRDYREAHNISDMEAQTSMNLTQQSQSEIQLGQVDAQLRILDDVESQIKRQDNFATLPNVVEDPGVKAEIDRYNTQVNAYSHLAKDQTEESEIVRESKQKLIDQKNLILRNIASAKNGIRQHRSSIASVGGRSVSQLSAQPSIDKGLQEIFREQSVKVNIYTFLLQKREEIALQKTLATATAQLIDNPSGSGPVAPNRPMILLMGFIIGLLIPGLLILLRRLLVPKFNDQEELERLTSVPILGEICTDDSGESVIVGANIASPIAELFRLMRNNINFTSSHSDKMVIMLTSTISGEGKTFITVNLAMTYALTNKKVCMVGLDVRRPVLAHACGLHNDRGVTTYLSNQENDMSTLIHQTSFNENLYVLPAGPIPPNPNELLLSPRMADMFEYLRNNFDIVIVDTSPIGMVSDTFLITPYSDIQIFVARANYTSPKSLKAFHNAVNQKRLPRAYIVLNGVNMTSSTYIYRRYGHYAFDAKRTYGYGYGYGANDTKKGKGFFKFLKRKKH